MTDKGIDKKIIIALTGQIASGKDVTKKYLTEKYGAQSVKFSQILRDVLNRLSLPIERKTMQTLSTVLRQNFGEDLLAKNIAEDAKKLDAEIVVIDGVRRPADILHAKNLEGFVLVKIEATAEIRYQRAKTRNENVGDDKKTFEEFLADHETEADKEVPTIMAQATETLDNNGDFDALYKQIDELVLKLRN
jgi:dephospho-CoA kinase